MSIEYWCDGCEIVILRSISEKTTRLGKASYCCLTVMRQVLEKNLQWQVSTLGDSKNFSNKIVQNFALLAHCPVFDHIAAWLNTPYVWGCCSGVQNNIWDYVLP